MRRLAVPLALMLPLLHATSVLARSVGSDPLTTVPRHVNDATCRLEYKSRIFCSGTLAQTAKGIRLTTAGHCMK